MLKLRFKFDELTVDQSAAVHEMSEALEKQVRLAVAEAVKAMIDKVPVYTGTSRGTLRVIGEIIGVPIPISPIATRAGQGPGVGESQSKASIEQNGLKIKFNFSTDVKQFLINEFYAETSKTGSGQPWGAIEEARKVFREYLRANLAKNMPGLKKFVVRTRVTGE